MVLKRWILEMLIEIYFICIKCAFILIETQKCRSGGIWTENMTSPGSKAHIKR